MSRDDRSPEERRDILANAGYNIDMLPSTAVLKDYQTDSLMHTNLQLPGSLPSPEKIDARLAQSFSRIFGFPFVIPVAQGRLAEHIVASSLIQSPGRFVLSNACFPTTKAHIELQGAKVITMKCASDSSRGFHGDLDIAGLAQDIQRVGAQHIAYLLLETCSNAGGGHPISFHSLESVRRIATELDLPLYLDATRIISNAYLIQQRDPVANSATIEDIILRLCSYADGLTLSGTKEFPTSVGALIATRSADVFARCRDRTLLLGSGLDLFGKQRLLSASENFGHAVHLVKARVERVRRFHGRVFPADGDSEQTGAHALFLRRNVMQNLGRHLKHPERAFLNYMFVKHGVRGALNPGGEASRGEPTIRFAVPILGRADWEVEADAENIRVVIAGGAINLRDLEEVSRPAGLSGGFMATYREIEEATA